MKLTRAKLESLIGGLIEKTFTPVKAVLKDAKVDISKINEVVLVGGMTKNAEKFIEEVKKFFGKRTKTVRSTLMKSLLLGRRFKEEF